MYSRNIVRPRESITVAKSRSFLSASKGYAVTSLSLSLSLSLAAAALIKYWCRVWIIESVRYAENGLNGWKGNNKLSVCCVSCALPAFESFQRGWST